MSAFFHDFTIATGIFYAVAAVCLFSAIMMVSVRDSVHALLFLLLTFFSAACIWLMLSFEFLAIILLLVYVGAVMVLFVFVIMMIRMHAPDTEQTTTLRSLRWSFTGLGIAVGAFIVFEMIAMIAWQFIGETQSPAMLSAQAEYGNTYILGHMLYSNYLYAFELVGVLLLLAIVAAIVLVHRPGSAKKQYVGKQVTVTKSDRLRIADTPIGTTATRKTETDKTHEENT